MTPIRIGLAAIAAAALLAACGAETDQTENERDTAPADTLADTAAMAPDSTAPASQETDAPAAAAAAVDGSRIAGADAEPGNWMTIGRTYDEAYYSPLDYIDAENIDELGLAWFYDLETFRGLEATPLAIDGVLYLSTPWNITYALDGATGELIWKHDPEVPRQWGRYACCEPVSRGLAAWEGKIVIATLDGRLIALDAETGDEIWTTQTFDNSQPYTITGAPRVFDGKVLIGNGGADLGVRGFVAAFDVDTGEELWRFWTVPGNPAEGFENAAMEMAAETWSGEWWTLGGGGTAWDAIAYDRDLNLVYIGTGNGSPLARYWRSDGQGDNLFLASIVAVDADTGEYAWHYQTAPGENWDFTATMPMILADLEIDGAERRVVMQAPKNGYFYVLDAATGELISANNYVPNNWSTEGADPETGEMIVNPDAYFGEEPWLQNPGPGGGHNWMPMSYNRDTGLVYFVAQEQWFAYSVAADFNPQPMRSNAGLGFGGDPHTRQELTEKPDHAWLAAWDPVANEEVWRQPMPRRAMTGVTSTAGNLVFVGRPDHTLAAYRATDGELLWSAPAQTTPMAAPVSYIADGQQYIAVAAGWGGGQAAVESRASEAHTQRAQARLLAFALGGEEELPELEADDTPISPPPPLRAAEATITEGRQLYADNCRICHGVEARGSDRDLRFIAPEIHDQFADIVLGGDRVEQGMPSFADTLDREQVEAVHAYIIARANEDWLDVAP